MTVSADAIVVGAGLSGLKVAARLVAAGKHVVVLEARDRVGGRVVSNELCGCTIDQGAQWVSPRHTRLLAEARKFGMETVLQFTEGRTILSLAGMRSEFAGDVPKIPALGQVELAMLQRRWNRETKTLPQAAPWRARNAAEWDSQTLETWIRKNLSTITSRAFARLVPAAFGAHASEVSYLWMLETLRSSEGFERVMHVHGGVLDARFRGGAYQIAQNMADELGERIVLSVPARAIFQSDSGVVVNTDKAEFEAQYLVFAVPPALCSTVEFNQVSPQRHALSQRMPQTPAIKVHVAYDDRFWRRRGYSGRAMSDALPLSLVMEDMQERPMLAALSHGTQALELSALSDDKRREKVVACLVDLFGPDASEPIGYADKDWLADAWARGYAGTLGPGILTKYREALREPCGRIHWASSETAMQWPGYMEGALESGERAAGEVLARL